VSGPCTHETTLLRYKIDSLGRRLYLRQCSRYGVAVTPPGQNGLFIRHELVIDKFATPFDADHER
jgi:hypothetical protein